MQPMRQERNVDRLSRLQRATVAVAGLAALIMVIAMVARVPDEIVRWLKFWPIAGLALAAVAARPRTLTMMLVTAAIALSALGDSFFFGILPAPGGRARITGIATFSLAYLLLIAAFWRGRPTRREARFVLPLVGAGLLICALVWPNLSSLMRVIVPIFTAIIVTMASTTLATRTRDQFPPAITRLVAPVGVLLVASDVMVALHMFHPTFSPTPMASELFLRLTYLAGWTLLLLAVQTPTTRST